MNYYERHLGDYARDTGHLSMLEHGAYTLLLDRYYATEKGIPECEAHRVGRARTRDEKAAVDTVLCEFFRLEDGLWVKDRVEGEIEKAHGRIEAARENGKHGGRPKKNPSKTQNKPSGFPLGSNLETQQKALHTPPNHQELPATPGDEAPADPDPIFGNGLAFLVRKGVAENGARGFLGAMRKEVRDDLAVIELLIEAERNDVCDPLAWLRAAGRKRARAGPQLASIGKTAQAIQALEDMKHGNRLGVGRDFNGDAKAPAALAGEHAGR